MTTDNGRMILQQALAARDWSHKEDIYAPVFDGLERLREVPPGGLSAVVISWRPEPAVVRCLEALKTRGGIDLELVFVDNGAGDAACEPLRPFADLIVHLNSNTGAYLARNLGALFASGEILLFVDDDGLPEPGFARAHAQAFVEHEVVSVRGVCRPVTDNPLNSVAGHYDLGPEPYPRFADLEGNSSYLASVFYALGGWNDAIRFGHGGIELSYRLWRLTGRPELQIYHPAPILHHDYIADEQALVAKREKQARAWRYIQTMHPDLDGFMKLWDRYKGRTDQVRPRAGAAEEAGPGQEHDRVSSLLNLAEHYRRQGDLEKSERYLAQARALAEK